MFAACQNPLSSHVFSLLSEKGSENEKLVKFKGARVRQVTTRFTSHPSLARSVVYLCNLPSFGMLLPEMHVFGD